MTHQPIPIPISSQVLKPSLSKPISRKEWELVEAYYLEKANKIHIPEDPKPFDITSINSQLEQLYHEARLDYYYAKGAFDNLEGAYRKLKRALYPIVKQGKNAEERDHLLQDHLMATKLDELDANILRSLGILPVPRTIYVMHESYKDRVDFLQAVLDLIRDKTGRLITDSGAMKIESSLRV